jgi:hypothetical protein
MTKLNSDGEVFGTRTLTLVVIALSALVLAGMISSPGQPAPVNARTVQTQQIVDTVHAPVDGASG